MRATTSVPTTVWRDVPRPPSNENILGTGDSFGPYAVFEELGAGGMASVHRAVVRFRNKPGKSIALKRLRPAIAADRQLVDAFVHESRLAIRLQHAHVVEAYAHGKIDDTYYLAMELVSGPTLKQIMLQSRSAAGAIPLPIVLAILIQLCDALDYVHNLCDERGRPLHVIHRDVSPTNIIVSRAGIVKLIDFGIAKDAGPRAQTDTGYIKGKFGYVAPEYTFGKLDSRVDLFAVGVIAHELLTGQPLFGETTGYEAVHSLREKPIHPPSRRNPHVSRELDDIVLTALQRDPDLRWQNAAAMRFALREVADQLGGVVDGPQIHAWAEWAFACEPRRDSSNLARLFDALEHNAAEPPAVVPRPSPPAPAPRAPARNATQRVARLPALWLWAVVAGLGLAAFLWAS